MSQTPKRGHPPQASKQASDDAANRVITQPPGTMLSNGDESTQSLVGRFNSRPK